MSLGQHNVFADEEGALIGGRGVDEFAGGADALAFEGGGLGATEFGADVAQFILQEVGVLLTLNAAGELGGAGAVGGFWNAEGERFAGADHGDEQAIGFADFRRLVSGGDDELIGGGALDGGAGGFDVEQAGFDVNRAARLANGLNAGGARFELELIGLNSHAGSGAETQTGAIGEVDLTGGAKGFEVGAGKNIAGASVVSTVDADDAGGPSSSGLLAGDEGRRSGASGHELSLERAGNGQAADELICWCSHGFLPEVLIGQWKET